MPSLASSAGELASFIPPTQLPSFADVGGMEALKHELSDTFGLLLACRGEAEAYKITWNGVLLHGPPGSGKTFIAKATAGEFGLNLVHVATSQLAQALVGQSARNVEAVFRAAAANLPCVLFFDELDAVALARQDLAQESRALVNQLLQSLERFRAVPELVVVAATNDLDHLDPAVVRPGRFDRHVRVDLPDEAARAAIFVAQLQGRPTAPSIDYAELAQRSSGMSAAAIAQVVELAALDALRRSTAVHGETDICTDDLLRAFASRGGTDRPHVDEATWDDIVLASETKAELQELETLLEDPEQARALGVDPPTGVLLTGPPGTGKTTIARVLAAQAHCSFYPVSAGDLLSKWVGESEQNVQRLFARARENAPSIVFIDEIDALASSRDYGSDARPLNELLQEIDGLGGQRGVFVLAATNRPDVLDPALVRGGRLSRTIVIPLPDRAGRLALLERLAGAMPREHVDLEALAGKTEGFSGADLKALCQQAALAALVRRRANGAHDSPHVTQADFEVALNDLRTSQAARADAA